MPGRIDLGNPEHRAFFDQLIDDPEFRARVHDDPVGALRRIGVEADPGELPDGPVALPSPEDLRAIRDRLLGGAEGEPGSKGYYAYTAQANCIDCFMMVFDVVGPSDGAPST